ncbi:MAG: DUF1887 family CARF protein [Rhodocyclaceae bacterium]|nr:DUF1887 family CARF protein [Rhodocyclaceae bacterium]
MTIHILLVSAQAAPNLLPALDSSMKPTEAILLVSKAMSSRADALEKVLKESGVKTSRIALANEHDFTVMESTLLDIAAAQENQDIALNLTGGTKLMALAAQSIAQAANWRMFYVDADTDEVIWLGKNAQTPHKLSEQLRLRHYLRAYGFELQESPNRPQATRAQRDLTQTLITQIGSLEAPITQLNWLAQQAEDRRQLTIQMNQTQQDSRSLEALLRNFTDAGILSVKGDHITFPDEVARDFVKGGWLEHHVYDVVANVTGDLAIRDKAMNLTVSNQGVINELDIALMARNRLFVIECKTARMDKPEAPKANDTLFKLSEVCRRVGGLGTRGMLASYRPLRPSEMKLAQALNIELVCGNELTNLNGRLKSWIRK